MFYYEYDFVTATEAGVEYFYRVGAAVRTKIQDATGTEPAKYAEIIEWRGYVETTKADYFEAEPWKTYGYSRDGKVTDEELTELTAPGQSPDPLPADDEPAAVAGTSPPA